MAPFRMQYFSPYVERLVRVALPSSKPGSRTSSTYDTKAGACDWSQQEAEAIERGSLIRIRIIRLLNYFLCTVPSNEHIIEYSDLVFGDYKRRYGGTLPQWTMTLFTF
jgi:hypothetical protein